MRLDVRRAIAVAVLATACGDASSDDPTAPLPHVPRTPDAFAPIGRTPNADAATNPGADAGEPGDAGPDWAPPLALKFVDIPHDAPLLRATDLAFLPQGSPEFLWLDKDGEVHHMRLQGDRARRLGGFHVQDTWFDSDAGLLSVAFDPDFAHNRFVYLGAAISMQTSIIRRYHFDPGDYAATAASGVEIFRVTGEGARRSWHNIGSIGFGDDGLLWALFGDKTLGDPALDPASLLGSLVRIRPLPGPEGGYEVPDDNPYALMGGHPAVYAKGMRSPWKGLFYQGRWFFGDVGLDSAEEVNLIDAPGQNFGWPIAEGPCEQTCDELRDPWVYYDRSSSHPFVAEDTEAVPARLRSVWVGWIYRPDWPGAENDPYLGRWRDVLTFGDWATGFVRGRRVAPPGEPDTGRTWPVGHLYHSTAWAQGPDGYVYTTALGTWPADSMELTPSPGMGDKKTNGH
jgi:glucose/arabinose dehydrogenase